jgi:methionyl-tRNA formyltransferase
MNKKTNFAFFGSGPLAESVLAALYRNDFIPSLVITTQDKKVGRNLELQKNHIKI